MTGDHPSFFKQPVCKPDSVRFWSLFKNLKPLPSFILAPYRYDAPTTYPPASDEQPSAPVYMVFQPIRCTAHNVAIMTGKLLPHLFTLFRTFAFATTGWLFSVTLLYPHGYLPVRKYGALCCPDFPLRLTTERWNGLLQCKGMKLTRIWVQTI